MPSVYNCAGGFLALIGRLTLMQTFQFDFGQLILLKEDNIVIGRMLSGINLDEGSVYKIHELAHSIYRGNPWVYISDRESSYSVDPMLYQKVFNVEESMVGFIVVAHRPLTQKVAEIERAFTSKKYVFVVCNSLSEATDEARKTLDEFRVG